MIWLKYYYYYYYILLHIFKKTAPPFQLALLLGSDYTQGIRGVGHVLAAELIGNVVLVFQFVWLFFAPLKCKLLPCKAIFKPMGGMSALRAWYDHGEQQLKVCLVHICNELCAHSHNTCVCRMSTMKRKHI
jgi:hypothetical protein